MEIYSNLSTYVAVGYALVMLGSSLFNILLMLSVRYSVRANSVEGGGIYVVTTLCLGYICAIVYACVKRKLATAPIDTVEKLADKKRSTICLVLGLVAYFVLIIAGMAVIFGGTISSLMAIN